MWIVPKQLSHFAPGLEAWNWASEELAWMFSQSCTWRTKLSSKQIWLRRLKRVKWLQRLSGRTLRPSMHSRFVEWWTGALVATLASHFPQREKGRARKTQGTCGPTSENTSEQLDLFGASSKMSKDTLPLGCVTSLKTWSEWITERRSAYSQRKKLALRTSEKESTSWGTPQASDHIEGARTAPTSNQKCLGRDLNRMTWATPNTMDYMKLRSDEGVKHIATGARKGRKRPSNLREQVDERTCRIYKEQNWPTPRTGGGSRPNGKGGRVLNEEVKIEAGIWKRGEKRSQQDPEKSNTDGKSQESSRLNPNWVEQLMGLPVGWTQISTEWIDSDCLAMESSPKPQN